jgi:hypothetical protein
MKEVHSRQPLRAVALLAPLLLCSCRDSKQLPVYPVNGRVFFQNRPATGALVVFLYVGEKEQELPLPSGYVREDGSFTLTTYAPDDGAPEGHYNVVITWTDPRARPDHKTGEVPNRLPARYASPQTSPLLARVEKGAENRPVFRLEK